MDAKKIYSFLLCGLLMLVGNLGNAQYVPYGYIPEKATGNLYHVNFVNPALSNLIGEGLDGIAGSDFDLEGDLYAITETDGLFVKIDTTNASYFEIETVAPPDGFAWTGMACDPNDGAFYICCADQGGNSAFYNIDLNTGDTVPLGTNDVGRVVGIAFDDNNLYGIYLEHKLYRINKNNISNTTLITSELNACASTPNHGLDYDPESEALFMISYNDENNQLWMIDPDTGEDILMGNVDFESATIALDPFIAGFSADTTNICAGDAVNFFDESSGEPDAWLWTFQGGDPASSIDRNPEGIIYDTEGSFDVSLQVSYYIGDPPDTVTETITKANYIVVSPAPGEATQPEGEDMTCQGNSYEYTTTEISNADDYEWELDPLEAGTLNGSGTTVLFTGSLDWTGSYTVRVRGTNNCGDGPWSTALECELLPSPAYYDLSGGGEYCEGSPGANIILQGSEVGFVYELYRDGGTLGIIKAGTGDPLDFGNFTIAGTYTVLAYADLNPCSLEMGEAEVTIIPLPGPATEPVGPLEVCNSEITGYSTSEISNVSEYIWSLSPGAAGSMIQNENEVTVVWSESYAGEATLAVMGHNDCGDGDSAFILIEVSEMLIVDIEIIVNEEQICSGDTVYFTANPTNPGENPVYKWTINGNHVGENLPEFNTTNIQDDDVVSCELTSSLTCVLDSTAVSNQITISVNPWFDISLSISTEVTSICEGDTTIFTSEVENASTNAEYAWFINGEDQAVGISTFITDKLQDEDYIQAFVLSDTTCAINPSAWSNKIQMFVSPVPEVGELWISTIPDIGTPVVLVVCCPGEEIEYEYTWYKNGSVIPGATGQYYYAPGGISEGVYQARVTNEFQCGAYSDEFEYAVNKALFEDEDDLFTVYPNPSSGQFTLVLNNESIPAGTDDVKVSLYTTTGELLYNNKLSSSTEHFDFGHISSGLYIIEISLERGKRQIEKLFIH